MNTGAFYLYGYLFAPQFDNIIEYKVFLIDGKHKVYKARLDGLMQAFPDQVLAYVADELGDALRYIVQDLRSIEIENGTYPTLEKGDLPITYLPIIAAIEQGINAGSLPSVNFFGQAEKYKDPIGVHEFLNTFGYIGVKTSAPDVYVLSDYVSEEKPL